jgi:hypothetical protein
MAALQQLRLRLIILPKVMMFDLSRNNSGAMSETKKNLVTLLINT